MRLTLQRITLMRDLRTAKVYRSQAWYLPQKWARICLSEEQERVRKKMLSCPGTPEQKALVSPRGGWHPTSL